MHTKILVIDDDAAAVRELEKILVESGFDVIDAPDGMLGVQRAIRHKPDLIVMELHFPAGGAPFVLKNLRQSIITRGIPSLVMTRSMDSNSKQTLREFGILTYIQKPCDKEELLFRIRQLVKKASPDVPSDAPQSSAAKD